MRLTEEQRKAVMKERDTLRPCKTCEWYCVRHPGHRNVTGCINSENCNYAHDGWKPITDNTEGELLWNSQIR